MRHVPIPVFFVLFATLTVQPTAALAQQVEAPAPAAAPGTGDATLVQTNPPAPISQVPVRSILADAHAKLSKTLPAPSTASIDDIRAEADVLARRIDEALAVMEASSEVALTAPDNEPAVPILQPATWASVPQPSANPLSSGMPTPSHSAGAASDDADPALRSTVQPPELTLKNLLSLLNRRLELVEQRLSQLETAIPRP